MYHAGGMGYSARRSIDGHPHLTVLITPSGTCHHGTVAMRKDEVARRRHI
jgi:hypothetical protein